VNEEGWQRLSEQERAIIEFLLGQPDCQESPYLAGLDSCLVRQIAECADHCPSIEFRRSDAANPPLDMHLPCEAHGYNRTSGIPFDVMLFARDGQLSSLEFAPYAETLDYVPTVEELTLDW